MLFFFPPTSPLLPLLCSNSFYFGGLVFGELLAFLPPCVPLPDSPPSQRFFHFPYKGYFVSVRRPLFRRKTRALFVNFFCNWIPFPPFLPTPKFFPGWRDLSARIFLLTRHFTLEGSFRVFAGLNAHPVLLPLRSPNLPFPRRVPH